MQDLSNSIVAYVSSQGGKVPREQVFSQFTPANTPQQVQRAIEFGKGSGTLKKVLTWDAENSVAHHTIELP